MNTQYTIKNFRIFDTKGADIQFKPISILTGCNSSGKSSIVKSLLLLKKFVEDAQVDLRQTGKFRPHDYPLDFTIPGLKLGSIETSRNENAPDDEPIVFSYTASSPAVAMPFKVSLSFVQKSKDDISGHLESIGISTSDSSDIFLDVRITEDGFRIKEFNLNSQFILHFLRFCSYACLRRTKELELYYRSYEDSHAEWLHDNADMIYSDISSFEPQISQEEADLYDVAYREFMHNEDTRNMISDKLYIPLKKAIENRVLFYFPIFESFEGKKKIEIRKLLLEAKSLHGTTDRKIAALIADSFDKSKFESFLDFYRELENQKLDNIAKDSSFINSSDDDFFGYLKTVSNISFRDNTVVSISQDETLTFEVVYQFFANWQLSIVDNDGYVDLLTRFEIGNAYNYSHCLYESYLIYTISVLKHILLPDFIRGLNYIGNARTTVQRVYSFEDKDNNLVNAIESYVDLKYKYSLFSRFPSYKELTRLQIAFKDYRPGHFINKWLKELGIGESLTVSVDRDGLGAKLRLKKTKSSSHSLADEGYGVTQLVVLLMYIEIEILRCLYNKVNKYSLCNPTLAIEEPEISLHPSIQSRIADIMLDAFVSYGINFIIETHSEYLIRKIQTLVAKGKVSNENLTILYINGYQECDEILYKIDLDERGTLKRPFGKGFFDEADELSFELMIS